MKNILLLFLLVAFTSKNTNIDHIELGETLEIDFEYYPEIRPDYSWGFDDQGFYYISEHQDSLGYYEYNFETKNWVNQFFPLEGPNGLKRFDDFVKINDTLAFHALGGSFGFQFVHLPSGKVMEEFTFKEELINPGKVTFQSLYFDGEKIGFPIGEYKRSDDKSYTKEAQIYGFYSIKEKKFLNFIPFPKDFHDDVFSTNFLERNFLVQGDTIFVNFDKSHEIYAYNLNSELLFSKEVKTKNVNTNNPGRREDQMENMLITESYGKYSSFIKVGDGYYRTARTYPGLEIPSSINIKLLAKLGKAVKIEIIKLDKDLNIVAEGVLSGVPGSDVAVGDGIYVVKNDQLYLWWFLDKQGNESMEYFREIVFK